jgi:hypothetical protein
MSLADTLGIGAAAVTIAGGGLAIGRFSSEAYRTRHKESTEKAEDEKRRREEELNMRWAILGRPETDWNEATPGLRDVVADLVSTMSEHRKEDASLFEDLRKQVAKQGRLLDTHTHTGEDTDE